MSFGDGEKGLAAGRQDRLMRSKCALRVESSAGQWGIFLVDLEVHAGNQGV